MIEPPQRDAVSGALARAAFEPGLRAALAQARLAGQPLSLCMIDLDYLKSVNDAYGHARGDAVLRALVERLHRSSRAADHLYRYGGDEFVLLLPTVGPPQALLLAQRLLAELRATPVPGEPPLTLSVSVGVATFPHEAAEGEALFNLADERTFQAKRQGRGRVVGHAPDPAPALLPTLSRLIERDALLAQLHALLRALPEQRRLLLELQGPSGSGHSRFVEEAARVAALLGYEVRALPLAEPLATRETRPLLLLADGPVAPGGAPLPDGVRPSALLVAGGGPLPSEGWGRAEPLRLAPFSLQGTHIWLRTTLRWEPPAPFTEWLHHAAHGLPGALLRALRLLQERGWLSEVGGAWQLHPDYERLNLAALLELDPLRHPALPRRLTSFVGREAELAHLRALLDEHRLITLLGPGGVGKSRLAIEVADGLEARFPGGILFVSLAAARDEADVVAALAQAFWLHERPELSLLEQLEALLRDKQLLLILDNFERLVPCAPLVSRLLAAAPALHILVTSRTVLRLYGEQEFAVSPLPTPQPGARQPLAALAANPAVALWVARAQGVQPGFALTARNADTVAALCARLEGLPLAIELAAARSKLFTPRELLARLEHRLPLLRDGPRDLPTRQQALRDTIAWSYELLDGEAQRLFARLALFPGGSTVEAVEAISVGGEQPLAALAALVDNSLLQSASGPTGETRFVMLETLREYAAERFADAPDGEAVRARHLRFYQRLAEQAEPRLRGPSQLRWLRRLRSEQENLLVALVESLQGGAEALRRGARLAAALWRFWGMEGHWEVGRAWVDTFLAHAELAGAEPLRVRLLHTAGWLAAEQRDFAAAAPRFAESLALAEQLGDGLAVGYALWGLGQVARLGGALDEADGHYAQSLRMAQVAGDAWSIARALLGRGWVALARGDWPGAQAWLEQSQQGFRRLGDSWGMSGSLHSLGVARSHLGQWAEARATLEEGLALCQAAGDRWNSAIALDSLAEAAARAHEPMLSARYAAQAATLWRTLGQR